MNNSIYRRIFGGGGALAGVVVAVLVTGFVQHPEPQTLEKTSPNVPEGTVATFEITLPHVYEFDIRYAYKTEDGSAKASARDYDPKSGHVVFPSGTTTRKVGVYIIHDRDRNRGEHFYLKLYNLETRGFARGVDGWSSGVPVKTLPSEKRARARIHGGI